MNRFRPLLLLLVLLAAAAVACGGGDDEIEAVPQPAEAGDDAQVQADIPVEALPNPLPEPFWFRDERGEAAVVEVTETNYIVRSGDTLERIASAYCTTADRIQRLNGIVDPSQLRIGDELRIPISSEDCAILTVTQNDTGEEELRGADPGRRILRTYFVEAGDTLFDIGLAFNVTWRDLQEFNNLTDAEAAQLFVGQRLLIPAPEEPEPEADSEEAEAGDPDAPADPAGEAAPDAEPEP